MADAWQTSALLARRKILSGSEPANADVPAPILRSWQRCISHGLDLIGRPRAEPMTARELARIIERNERLRETARPEMDLLHAEADSTGCIVILTDAQGVILEAVGDPDFADRAARVALMPGVTWDEQASGTNAIGAAIAEGASIAVRGAEHFFDPHKMLTCAASPIRSPNGDILGVLDISGHADMPSAHAPGLVRMAVDQIEHRYFDNGFGHHHVVRLHKDRALIGTPREGILVFEDQRLVAANRYGLSLVGLDWKKINQAEFAQLFATGIHALADRGELRRPDGSSLFGRLDRGQGGVAHYMMRTTPPARPAPQERPDEPVYDANVQSALTRAIRLLKAEIPVLIQGETGAGKDVFARAAHDHGARQGKPFIAVNCAALPESLIESELFGYEEGAFTGARKQGSKGLLRAADTGTLFLDEIGDMPLALQARLLRVLQEREVTPLGGAKAVPVDFALICATHRDLSKAVERGDFRADLYFRIAQYTVALPALRDLADRTAVIDRLFSRMAAESALTLAPEALDALAAYHWPGNFRQLVGALKALVALAEPGECLGLASLPPEVRGVGSSTSLPAIAGNLEDMELSAMKAAVEAASGNISLAAKKLGVHRSTLYRRLYPKGAAGEA